LKNRPLLFPQDIGLHANAEGERLRGEAGRCLCFIRDPVEINPDLILKS
jgi:hypothetical protein